MSWVRVHLIVHAADRDWANTQAAGIDPDTGGDKTFGVPLSPTGLLPATHYGASTQMQDYTRDTVVTQLLPQRPLSIVLSEPYTWQDALNAAGVQEIRVQP